MGSYKKDVTPLLMHWSYVFLALTHRNVLFWNLHILMIKILNVSQWNYPEMNECYRIYPDGDTTIEFE